LVGFGGGEAAPEENSVWFFRGFAAQKPNNMGGEAYPQRLCISPALFMSYTVLQRLM